MGLVPPSFLYVAIQYNAAGTRREERCYRPHNVFVSSSVSARANQIASHLISFEREERHTTRF